MQNNINKDLAMRILREMPLKKRQSLQNALDRNAILTSCRVLPIGTLTVYREGWYLCLQGTRCQFSVYAEDNDGKLTFKRKPKESSLHKLYDQSLYFSESDFRNI